MVMFLALFPNKNIRFFCGRKCSKVMGNFLIFLLLESVKIKDMSVRRFILKITIKLGEEY